MFKHEYEGSMPDTIKEALVEMGNRRYALIVEAYKRKEREQLRSLWGADDPPASLCAVDDVLDDHPTCQYPV